MSEPWNVDDWDQCCTICGAGPMAWEGDDPESEAEAICHSCAEGQAYARGSADTVARIVARLRKTLPLQYGYVIEDIEREFKP